MTQLECGVETVDVAVDRGASCRPSFRVFAWRVVALHTLTYFLAGFAAYLILDYRQVYETTELRYLMVPTTSLRVAAGPALQPLRGLLFAFVLYPFTADFVQRRNGVLLLWGLFLGLAVLGTAGPSPGSFEGIIYTKLPLRLHLLGLPEVIVQTLLFSIGLVTWCRKPARWKNIACAICVGVVFLMSVAGVLASFASKS